MWPEGEGEDVNTRKDTRVDYSRTRKRLARYPAQHLVEVNGKYADPTPEAKRSQGRQDGGGADGKDHEVGERGDSDCHPRPPHGLTHPGGDVWGAHLFEGEVVVALHDHKHVVDADAQEEERNDVVHGPVEKTHSRADAIGEPNCKPNGSKTYRICKFGKELKKVADKKDLRRPTLTSVANSRACQA